MIKAMKKLKIWSKRKKKKKTRFLHQPPPPPHTGDCCCSWSPSTTQPSAPPLPPWIQFEQTQETVSVTGSFPVLSFDPPSPISEPDEFSSTVSLQTASSEVTPLYNASSPVKSESYQQYTVPTPVYDIPPPVVMASTGRSETERSVAGIFVCVVSVGSHLINWSCCSCFQKS